MSISRQRATELAAELRVDLTKVGGIEWWEYGVTTERDNLKLSIDAGVVAAMSGVDLDRAGAVIALEKLKRWPDWYPRLKACEDKAIKHWRHMKG